MIMINVIAFVDLKLLNNIVAMQKFLFAISLQISFCFFAKIRKKNVLKMGCTVSKCSLILVNHQGLRFITFTLF